MPVAPGAPLLAAETPALVVDLEALEANVQRLIEIMGSYPDVSIRPHAKTHKTVEVAALQLKQPQTVGVCCQKVSEAVAMADTTSDVLLSNEVASSAKAQRLAALARRGCTISAVVDSKECAELLAEAARVEGTRLGALIDVNVGQNRCGVDTPAEAVALAQEIAKLEELQFRGIQAYYGNAQHFRRPEERVSASQQAAGKAKEVKEALREAGFECEVITGGGSGTFELDAASNIFTEVQPGSYVFGDVDYSRNLSADGTSAWPWRQSLFVAATVMSRNEAERRVVLDAGIKAVSYDSGPPLVHGWPEGAARVESMGDEHTVLRVLRPEAPLPLIGEQVLLIPGHCDPTVNLHDHIVAVRGGVVEAVWQVAARGPGF